MSLVWLIYLADVAEHAQIILVSIGASIAFGGAAIALCAGDIKFLKWSFFGIILLLLAAPIPSKQTIYLMAAAKYGEDLSKNPEVQKISSKVLKILNEKLDQMEKK